jgi:Fe2+ or Zn2+ uptake regulation protein
LNSSFPHSHGDKKHENPIRNVINPVSAIRKPAGELPCNLASRQAATEYEQHAFRCLKSAGFRLTNPRTQVVRALAWSNRALSANDIHAAISSAGIRIDVVSVYRTLQTLLSVGAIHHIGVVNGYLACRESHTQGANVEHLVCGLCGCVTELSVENRTVNGLSEQSSSAGFQVEEIRVEVLGTCRHCRESAAG